MGNANDDVKAVANYVTTSVDENGIWNALKTFQCYKKRISAKVIFVLQTIFFEGIKHNTIRNH